MAHRRRVMAQPWLAKAFVVFGLQAHRPEHGGEPCVIGSAAPIS
jgi:hypothetical protein